MKILMINSVCGVGSTGRICTDLTAALETQGHEVKIAYGRDSVPEAYRGYALRIGSNFDTKIHGLRARAFDEAGLGSKTATQRFIEWVDQYSPDVIHLHNLHGYYIHVPTLFEYLRSAGKRVIWTLHDSWAFSGHSGTCDKVECTKWKDGCGNCPLKNQYPSSIVDRSKKNWKWKQSVFAGVENLTIVTPSKWLAAEVKESFLGEYDVRVIPNGIDTEVFKPHITDLKTNLGINGKYMILGVSNSWHKYKGLFDFYELSKMLDKDKFAVVLVGVTEKQKEEAPEGIVAITKTKNVEELVDYYSAADVFVNLTYCDVFGMVNIEALACETPVITYRTGGSPETVQDFGGVIVERGNIKRAYDETIKAIMEKKEVKNNSLIKSRYGKQAVMEQYFATYRE